MESIVVGNPSKYSNDIELKEVDNKSKLTVFGYIRISQQNLSRNIPTTIPLIILAFYADLSDEFDPNFPTNAFMKLSNNNKRGTCYGKQVISSITHNFYIWKLKLFGEPKKMNIGIKLIFSTIEYNFNPGLGELYSISNDRIDVVDDLPQFNDKDILTITLEFEEDEGILYIKKNNEYNLIARGGIVKNTEFRLFISLKPGDSVEILPHE